MKKILIPLLIASTGAFSGCDSKINTTTIKSDVLPIEKTYYWNSKDTTIQKIEKTYICWPPCPTTQVRITEKEQNFLKNYLMK